MKNNNSYLLGGINASLFITFALYYALLNSFPQFYELHEVFFGNANTIYLFPITTMIAVKIAVNFANRFAISIVLSLSFLVISSFAGILTLWELLKVSQKVLMFSPLFPYSDTISSYLNYDDVRNAGGYLGQFIADLTMSFVWNFLDINTSSEKFIIWSIALLAILIFFCMSAAFAFLNVNESTGKNRKMRGHSGKKGATTTVVNN